MYYNAKEAKDCSDFMNKYNIHAILETVYNYATTGVYFAVFPKPNYESKDDQLRFESGLEYLGFEVNYTTDHNNLLLSWNLKIEQINGDSSN